MILRFADLCVPIGLQLLSVAASSDLICPNSSHLRYDKFMDFSTFFFFKSTFVFFFSDGTFINHACCSTSKYMCWSNKSSAARWLDPFPGWSLIFVAGYVEDPVTFEETRPVRVDIVNKWPDGNVAPLSIYITKKSVATATVCVRKSFNLIILINTALFP